MKNNNNQPTFRNIDLKINDRAVIEVTRKLSNRGYECYIVGGAVRDLLIGKEPKDYDIVTNAIPKKIKTLFYPNSVMIGRRFKLCIVTLHRKKIEVATLRHPDSIDFRNLYSDKIEDDFQRRDFTINTLYYDVRKHQIIDFVGGLKDIEDRIIRPVLPLETIFTEDPVRMMRAIKFAQVLDFLIDEPLKDKIIEHISLIRNIKKARLCVEFEKILQSKDCHRIIIAFYRYEIFKYILNDFGELERELKRKDKKTDVTQYAVLIRLLIKCHEYSKEEAYRKLVVFFKQLLKNTSKFKLQNLESIIPVAYLIDLPKK